MLLKGKKRKDTVCIALVDEELEDSNIRMSKVFTPYYEYLLIVLLLFLLLIHSVNV